METLELFDVGTKTAVRLSWTAGAGPDEGVVRFAQPGGRELTLPASVVQLAAAVLQDPSLLRAAQG